MLTLITRYSIFAAIALSVLGVMAHADVDIHQPEELTRPVMPNRPGLATAVMAEGLRDFSPYNVAVVFSINVGSVSCYTLFDPVPERTFVIHRWYHRDRLSTQKRLALQPPRWATYSAIQLREVDKGPWRVEILDLEENMIHELRFSVTD